MLPINLLPNYIHERGRKPKLAAFYGAVIAAVAVFFIMKSNGVQKQVDDAKAELATATEKKTKYDAKVTEINKIKGEIAETETKQKFIADAQTYNKAWSDTYEQMRDLTADNILLKSMELADNHKTLTMAAFAADEMVIAKWWIYLKNHKEIFDNVTMQIPTHPFSPPAAGGAGGAPGSGGPGSGGFPGSGGPTIGSVGGVGSLGGPSSGGFPGSGGAGAAEGVGATEIEGRSGVNFIAKAVLHTALANGLPAPTWPAGGAAPAAAPGAFGGIPGSGGGPNTGGPNTGGPAGKE